MNLTLAIYKRHPRERYNFLKSRNYRQRNEEFEKFEMDDIKQDIRRYNKHQSNIDDIYKRIDFAVEKEFTELTYSLSKIKSLIVITESPLDELQMKQIQSRSEDEFYLVNFVFDQSKVREEHFITGIKKKKHVVFSLNDVDPYLESIAEKQLKKRFS